MTEKQAEYTVKPIQTTYAGYRFRSRLESRWAVFFDTLHIKWEYEPEGFQTKYGFYLPDFYLSEIGCYAEVKPQYFTVAQYQRCAVLPRGCLLLDQPHPTARPYYLAGCSESYSPYTPEPDSGFGWFVFIMSQDKRRPWLMFGEDYAKSFRRFELEAENAAKAARFEYGEIG